MISDDVDDDEDLFKPPPPKQECPLCFLPLSNGVGGSSPSMCCGKPLCCGCAVKNHAVRAWRNVKRSLKDPPEPPLEVTCPFCREKIALSREEILQQSRNRMALNDPRASFNMACFYSTGRLGLPKDEGKAEELCLRAAELGSAEACWSLAQRYHSKNQSKGLRYAKLAAKKGNVDARYNLGRYENNNDNYELAVKHWMISAVAGDDASLKAIRDAYRDKYATKDQYEEAIRSHQKAKEDMSSFERDMAKKYSDSGDRLSVFSETELAKLCGVRQSERTLFSEYFSAF